MTSRPRVSKRRDVKGLPKVETYFGDSRGLFRQETTTSGLRVQAFTAFEGLGSGTLGAVSGFRGWVDSLGASTVLAGIVLLRIKP